MPPKRIRLSMDQKIKLIEDSLKPGFDYKKAALNYGIGESSAYMSADKGVKNLKSKKSCKISKYGELW